MRKYAKYALIASMIVLAYAMGRSDEQQKNIKNYQVACVLSDCCRDMVNNLGLEAEEIYFETLDNLDCDPNLRINAGDVESYSWRY